MQWMMRVPLEDALPRDSETPASAAFEIPARQSRRFGKARTQPYGLSPEIRYCEWRVMKLMPLRKIAAPSPSVLSFLRHALEPSNAPCAPWRTQRCGYVTTGIVGRERSGARGVFARSESATSRSELAPSREAPFNVGAIHSGSALVAPQRFGRNESICTHASALHRRAFSTTGFSRGWNLFGRKRSRASRSLPPPPSLSDVTGDAPIPLGFESLGRMTRAANELKMRCTELDEQGNVTMVSGEFKKSELIAKVQCNSVGD